MICKLCCESNKNERNLINIDNEIAEVINKYFPFCFEDESKDGLVCEKCWLKVEMFHEFFIRIEQIHSTLYKNENIFAECIAEQLDIKINSEETLIETFPLKIENENKSANDEQNLFNENKIIDEIAFIKSDDDESKPDTLVFPNENVHQADNEIEYSEDFHFNDDHFSDDSDYFLEEQSFSNSESLENRKSNTKKSARREKRIICELCGRIYRSDYHTRHIQREHMVQEKLKCDICGVWLKNKYTMSTHMKFRHIQKPETCSICGKVSPNKKALATHKKIHLDTKERFKCIVCGSGFRDKTTLKEHSYIHSGITDAYRCNYCDKTFRFGSLMYTHRKKAHPVEEHARVYGSE